MATFLWLRYKKSAAGTFYSMRGRSHWHFTTCGGKLKESYSYSWMSRGQRADYWGTACNRHAYDAGSSVVHANRLE